MRKIRGTFNHPATPPTQFMPPPPGVGAPPQSPQTSHHVGHAAVGVDAPDVFGVRGVGAAVEEQCWGGDGGGRDGGR